MLLILTFLYFLQAYLRTLEKQIGIKAILTLSFKPESLEKKKKRASGFLSDLCDLKHVHCLSWPLG